MPHMETGVFNKISQFFKKYRSSSYKKGELLIRADEDPKGIFYLEEGIVKLYTITKNGDELLLHLFKPPSFFPISWALNNTKNPYYYEALSKTKSWIAPKNEVIGFMDREPEVVKDLLRRTYRGMDEILKRMGYIMNHHAFPIVVEQIVIWANRFGSKGSEGSIRVKVSEKDLAASCGLARETVSRELKILKEKGLISIKNHELIIKDIGKLQKELSFY